MARTGKITLEQGVGKNTGKPYTALNLIVGKWSSKHFPTAFERDYLVEYLRDKEGSILLNDDGTIQLVAGEYSHKYRIESSFEQKYVENFLRSSEEQAAPSQPSGKTILDEDDDEDGFPFK